MNLQENIQRIREMMGLGDDNPSTKGQYEYIGTCVNSFDEYGECLHGAFYDEEHFFHSWENAVDIPKEEFWSNIDPSSEKYDEVKELEDDLEDPAEYRYSEEDDIYFIFVGNHTHYFFVNADTLDTLHDTNEEQLNHSEIIEQQIPNLTVPEQTLLGFLNRFLRGEEGEFQNTPDSQLGKTMLFNTKTIYPMAQKLLEKKNTGRKTYDDKTFNALFMSMDKSITKEQQYEFFKEGGTITNIKYNSQF